MDPFYYYTIEQPSMAEFKDRGSKFLAYAYPAKDIDTCKKLLAQLKKEHGKAVHHCLAYRLGVDGSTFRVSDDGEPAGSAGRPILGQIDSKGLTNVFVVVVRGLINAYKTATALALQLSPIIKKPIEIPYELNFDYHQMNEVMMLVKHYNCSVVEQTAQLFIQLHIGIPKNRLDEVLEKLGTLRDVTIKTTLKVD
jgi:putative IMPACT (imprinted ancient) family translation regulator